MTDIVKINKFRIEKFNINVPEILIEKSHFLIITGENGSGKTTLMNELHIELQPNSLLMEQHYENLIYPYKKVWWNIMIPKILKGMNNEEARISSETLLKEFNLLININRFPNDLSGGEKHLVLFLRFLNSGKQFLLLDEPTTGIDSDRIDIFWDILYKTIAKNINKVILITHIGLSRNIIIKKTINIIGVNNKLIKINICKFNL